MQGYRCDIVDDTMIRRESHLRRLMRDENMGSRVKTMRQSKPEEQSLERVSVMAIR